MGSERALDICADENTDPFCSLFIECKAFLIGMFFAVINWRRSGGREGRSRRSPHSCQVPPMMSGEGNYTLKCIFLSNRLCETQGGGDRDQGRK